MVCADRYPAVAIDDLRPTGCESLTRKNYSGEDNEGRKQPFHDHYLNYLDVDYLYSYFTSFDFVRREHPSAMNRHFEEKRDQPYGGGQSELFRGLG